ncbi:hypothetical protein K5X82_12985 [Halosquirtibacter xylanolyticus]|uniref:hypothetical protein n=1 Tax=Halosquirtibacter xylanolyticus TaxID=3374599 RepID=UPI003748313D|nr:hypothetical protein K5X82_12985 [Prolixibacteraceae bacterium]
MNSILRILLIIVLFINAVGVYARPTTNDSESLFHYYNSNEVLDYTGIIKKAGQYHLFYTERMLDGEKKTIVLKQAVSEDLYHWNEEELNNSPFSVHDTIKWGIFTDDAKMLGASPEVYLLEIKDDFFQLKVLDEDKWERVDKTFSISSVDLTTVSLPVLKWSMIIKKWVLTLTDLKSNDVKIYTSQDLEQWDNTCVIKEDCSRSEMFEKDGKTFFMLSNNIYEVDLTKRGQDCIIARRHLDYGGGYNQTLVTNINDETVLMGGISVDNYNQDGSSLKLSSPRRMNYREGKFFYAPYLQGLSKEKGVSRDDKKLIPGLGKNILSGKFGDAYVLEGNIKYDEVSSYGFLFKVGSKSSGYELRYYKKQNIYQCTGGEMAVKPVVDYAKVLVVVDNGFIDFYYGDGSKVMSISVDYTHKASKIILFHQGGELYVKNIKVNPLSFKKK